MPMNWRRPIIFGLLRARGSPIVDELRLIRSLESQSPAKIQAVQDHRLAMLLRHAWENTEYYRSVLSACGVVQGGKSILGDLRIFPF
jgi:phenylacetate-coenzyme A ligase PaaK-like adenylate-forming protein